jgi:rsbT co-antagonist protein RsbR
MVGMDLFELYKPVPSILDSLRRALSGEEVRTTVEVGPGIWFDGLSLPLRNSPNGPVEGVIGFAMDVSDRLNTEKALREQLAIVERQNVTMTIFQRVLETTAVVLWCMDTAGTCTISEGKGLDLIGLKPGEMVGSNVLDAYKDNEEIAMSLVRALGGEEVRMISSPVPGLYFDSWSVPLRHEGNGEIQGVVGFAIDATDRIRTEMEVREKLALIERQSATIRALATPIIQVWDEVLCLPVIGTVDSARTADMMQGLLESIVREQARFAIVDLTGVEVVDTSTADHLIQLFRAAKVLGVDGVLCGIRPAVAQTVVALGLDLASVRTMRSLRDALKWCIRARMQPDSTRPKEKETALPSRRLNGQRV